MAVEFPLKIVDPGEIPNEGIYTHLVACAENGTDPGELCHPQSVTVDTTTKHIYVAEGGTHPNFARVSIFSETGEFLNSYAHEDMESLYGIAIHGDDLFVTDWVLHCVFRIKIDSDFRLVCKLGSKGSDIGQFDHPFQLSISTNGDLYIADFANHRIQILDDSLHTIRAITHPSMHYPRDVKLTTDEIYVLSDQDDPCVHVFSSTGHKIRSLIRSGWCTQTQVISPFGFSLDDKRLIISDFYTDQVRIFSEDGKILEEVGELGPDGIMFYRPTGIALTSNLLVIISLNDDYGLRIFSSL